MDSPGCLHMQDLKVIIKPDWIRTLNPLYIRLLSYVEHLVRAHLGALLTYCAL